MDISVRRNYTAGSTAVRDAPAYLSGFGNAFETEALPGALPLGRNSTQGGAHGLYAEQLSSSPFTPPQAANKRSWPDRIPPTVGNWGRSQKVEAGIWRTVPCTEARLPPALRRWDPIPMPNEEVFIVKGIRTTTAGDAATRRALARPST